VLSLRFSGRAFSSVSSSLSLCIYGRHAHFYANCGQTELLPYGTSENSVKAKFAEFTFRALG
jgi:hypothetical protein